MLSFLPVNFLYFSLHLFPLCDCVWLSCCFLKVREEGAARKGRYHGFHIIIFPSCLFSPLFSLPFPSMWLRCCFLKVRQEQRLATVLSYPLSCLPSYYIFFFCIHSLLIIPSHHFLLSFFSVFFFISASTSSFLPLLSVFYLLFYLFFLLIFSL